MVSYDRYLVEENILGIFRTGPDTRLPQSRAVGQGLYLRSLDRLGQSSKPKDRKKQNKPNWATMHPLLISVQRELNIKKV